MNLFAILRLFLALIIITITGLPFTLILLPLKLKQGLLFTGTISFVIGVGNISLVMMLMSLLEFSFSLKTILFSQTIICLIGFLILIYKKRYSKLPEKMLKNNKFFKKKKLRLKILNYKNYFKAFNKQKIFKIIEITLIILILFQVLASIFIALIFPVRFWDAITCWSFKAKAFFLDKAIYDFYSKHSYEFSHPSYPLLLPFLQTYLYLSMGILNENLVKIIFPIFYISLLIAIYSFLRLKYLKIVSLFFTFVLSTVPIICDHAYIEYTNLPFAFYLFLSVMFMALWMKYNENRLIILSAIFTSQLPLLRSEGIIFSAFILIMFIFLLLKSKEYDKKSFLSKEDIKINHYHKHHKYKKCNEKANLLLLTLVIFLIFITPWLIIKFKLDLKIISIDWIGFQNSITFFKENFMNSIIGLLNEFLFSKYDSTNSFFKSSYSIYWIIIIFTFVIFPEKVFVKENGVILSIIIFSIVIYLIGSSLVPDFLTSIERYLLHIFPISFLLAVSILSEKLQPFMKRLNKSKCL